MASLRDSPLCQTLPFLTPKLLEPQQNHRRY